MRPRINLSLQVAAGILALIAPCFLAAQGAPAVSLEEQLSAQYTLVKMGSDSSGPAVVEPGTILAIQKGGILGVPYGNMNMLPAKYQDGTLHPPATATSNSATSMGSKVCGLFGKCNSTKEQVGKQTTTRLFQVGEKVYPSKIEVHPDKDIVALSVIACDSCNNVNPTMDEVSASLGQPEKIVNRGPKQIYVYKDLKVTFVRGKVVDVQ